ncbi:hypothetical protein PVAP13_4KG385303 [Panicum virgatum]|uniref:Uncharacterized protein n=1 Tax=Panicum virgatum TaxID=38727 RepID=A0A8T0TZN0_PANVG|nr:hypothetical protein PVAP13_4KG385303 [Panicum virgatum]
MDGGQARSKQLTVGHSPLIATTTLLLLLGWLAYAACSCTLVGQHAFDMLQAATACVSLWTQAEAPGTRHQAPGKKEMERRGADRGQPAGKGTDKLITCQRCAGVLWRPLSGDTWKAPDSPRLLLSDVARSAGGWAPTR